MNSLTVVKEREDILLKINQLFDDFENSKKFYKSIEPYVTELLAKVNVFCEKRENYLLTVSKKIDPSSKLVEELVYNDLEISIKNEQDKKDFDKVGVDEFDIIAKWSSISLTSSQTLSKTNTKT